MLTIGFAAPFEPPLGGATVSSGVLWDELSHRDDIHAVRLAHNHLPRGRQPRDLRNLAREVRSFTQQCDVLTVHAARHGTTRFGPLIALAAKATDTPLVFRVFGGTLGAWVSERPRARRAQLSPLFRTSTVLLQTRALVEQFSEWYPQADVRWFPTHRLPRSPRPPDRETSDPFRYVYVGHVCERKGLGLLVDATRTSTREWTLDVYGPAMDGFDLARLQGNQRLTYGGVVPARQLQERLADYDALVLPSSHLGEGYPGAIIEAFAAGLPVVASKWLSIPEIVKHGSNGLLVPPNDLDALVQRLDTLSADHRLATELRAGATESSQTYSSTVWADWLVGLCSELSSQSG